MGWPLHDQPVHRRYKEDNMAKKYVENLKVCFLIKIDGHFYNEWEIAEDLAVLKRAAAQGKIDLDTTDGAISIRYNNDELLGTDFWDEINLIAGSIASNLSKLTQGQPVIEFFPLNSLWLHLTPKRERVVYELKSSDNLSLLRDMKRSLPKVHFIREFELMFWRMVKLLADLGSYSAQETLRVWPSFLHPSLANIVDTTSVQRIVDQPLEVVLTSNGCGGNK